MQMLLGAVIWKPEDSQGLLQGVPMCGAQGIVFVEAGQIYSMVNFYESHYCATVRTHNVSDKSWIQG